MLTQVIPTVRLTTHLSLPGPMEGRINARLLILLAGAGVLVLGSSFSVGRLLLFVVTGAAIYFVLCAITAALLEAAARSRFGEDAVEPPGESFFSIRDLCRDVRVTATHDPFFNAIRIVLWLVKWVGAVVGASLVFG